MQTTLLSAGPSIGSFILGQGKEVGLEAEGGRGLVIETSRFLSYGLEGRQVMKTSSGNLLVTVPQKS